jgi:hypothetical protein
MDIDQHVNQIVQNIVQEITTKVQEQAMRAVQSKISEVVEAIDARDILTKILSQKLDDRLSRLPIDSKAIETEMANRVSSMATKLIVDIQSKSIQMATESIQSQINKIEFPKLCQNALVAAVKTQEFVFPDGSIPALAVRTDEIALSGNQILGGIIKSFSSTGIDDKATGCQLTIFDDVTVVENNLITRDLTVKGTTTVEGDLVVTGRVPEDSAMYMNLVRSVTDRVKAGVGEIVFDGYADKVFNRIRENGLDLAKITLNGQEIVNGGNLSNFITFSNLQRVGTLSELRVGGEALLSQTLYTTTKRVGINTVEPAQALSIWDQEVEIGFGKRETNVAVIEAPRNQRMIVGVNGKSNLVLMPDGGVVATRVSIGATTLTSSNTPPNYDAAQGTIVFNSTPTIGGPLGWVSLGGARWANFGFVD